MVKACLYSLNILSDLNGIDYISNHIFLFVLKLCYPQIHALTPTVKHTIDIQCHEERVSSLNLLHIRGNMMLPELTNKYLINAGLADLK